MGSPRRPIRFASPRLVLIWGLSLALGLGLAVAAVAPAPVVAHAELVLADPSAGTGLPQAPGSVVLKFSEPLDLGLSRIEIVDAAGREVDAGPTRPVPGDPEAMQRSVGSVPIGLYTVRWTSVSLLDGHTLQGSYTFGVGTAAPATSESSANALDTSGPLDLVGRLLAIVGLCLWVGAVVLRRASITAGLDPFRTRQLARAGPGLALGGTLLSAIAIALTASGSVAALPAVFATPSGLWRLLLVAAALMGLVAGPDRVRTFAAEAIAAVISQAASGHAAATPLPGPAVVAVALHLTGAGVWTFAIAASAVAATNLRRALSTFTPYAVGAAVVVGLTGIANAATELTTVADLTHTGYGAFVIAKGVLFLVVAALGLGHLVGRRRDRTAGAALSDGRVGRAVAIPARLELVAVALALAVAATMTGFANLPRETAAEAPAPTIDPVLTALAGREALSVAGASGPFVVGLTVLPPRPGPVELRVQVLGVAAGDGLRAASVRISPAETAVQPPAALPIASIPLPTPCGLGCFAGPATIPASGDWIFDVALGSNRGPLGMQVTLHLPAADGSAAFSAAMAAMDRLRSATLQETLSGSVGGPTISATYTFAAPDAMAITVEGTERRIIGTVAYDRSTSGAWSSSPFPPPGFGWPTAYYATFWARPAAIRLLPDQTIGGVTYEVVAFVRPDLPAWFRLWIDPADGLVHRAEMLAEGHIMEHAYGDFDTARPVLAPPGVPTPTPGP